MGAIDRQTAAANSRKFGEVIARTLHDEAFKKQLLANPKAVLTREGLVIPEEVEIRAVQNTDRLVHLPLPPKPPDELSDDALEQVSGGSTAGCAGTVGTASSWTTTVGTLSSAGTAGSA